MGGVPVVVEGLVQVLRYLQQALINTCQEWNNYVVQNFLSAIEDRRGRIEGNLYICIDAYLSTMV